MAGLPQLIEDLQRLSEDQDSADVVFVCGREEERIYAHRIILMTRFVLLLNILLIINALLWISLFINFQISLFSINSLRLNIMLYYLIFNNLCVILAVKVLKQLNVVNYVLYLDAQYLQQQPAHRHQCVYHTFIPMFFDNLFPMSIQQRWAIIKFLINLKKSFQIASLIFNYKIEKFKCHLFGANFIQ